MTDLGGRVVERYILTPYGELTAHQESGYGDPGHAAVRDAYRPRNGHGLRPFRRVQDDVDSTDKGTVGTTCTGTVSGSCRILDLDFDGDYDSTDATKFDALPQGVRRQPGRTVSGLSQPFGHQGLVYDAEIGSYQNRARVFQSCARRYTQRDPLGMLVTHDIGLLEAAEPACGPRESLVQPCMGGPSAQHLQYRDGVNLYAYLKGTPLVSVDPDGTVSIVYGCTCNCIGPGGWRARAKYVTSIKCPVQFRLCCGAACVAGCEIGGPAAFRAEFTACMFLLCIPPMPILPIF
jgi:RHS repeat-associated protein